MKLVIIFPHGGGGHWLGNLIYHLENNSTVVPTVSRTFDSQPQSKNILLSHGIEWYQPNIVSNLDISIHCPKIIFCCNYAFNIYLNDTHKAQHVKYQKMNFLEKFHQLTDTARHFLTNIDFKNFYQTNIDLKYNLIFEDPIAFINNLFLILDQAEIVYDRNVDYCLSSIKNYRKTCLNPKDFYGNTQAVEWLAWVHAICLINNIQILQSFGDAKLLEDFANILDPYQNLGLEITNPVAFKWNS
jgi:hypothetical protein